MQREIRFFKLGFAKLTGVSAEPWLRALSFSSFFFLYEWPDSMGSLYFFGVKQGERRDDGSGLLNFIRVYGQWL